MLVLNPNVSHSALVSKGVPKRTIGLYKPFNPAGACSQFLMSKYNDNGDEIKAPVHPKTQLAWLNRLIDDPYHGPYVAYLSDYKEGDISRTVAAAVFSNAMHSFQVGTHRERPRWIRLHQGFDTQIPLYGSDRPSLLVLDNVFADSTQTKVEKIRDIISAYDDTPVIVIVSTPGSPLSLVERFHLQVDYGILLRDTRIMTKEESV